MSSNSRNNIKALFFIGILFFIFGFITWANSQLIPYLKIACELTDAQSYLVASAFFAAYFVMAIPSSMVLKAIGFKKGISVGLFTMAVGALVFIPAAQARSYPLFLTGLFIIGTGLALLQTASNPYVTILGPVESAAKRISIMGICNKIAGILSVYILGSITLKNVDALKEKLKSLEPAAKALELDQLAAKVVDPYIVIAVSLAVLAVIFFFLQLPEVKEEEIADTAGAREKTSIMQFPFLWFGVFAIFFYVGVEVMSYDTFTGFGESVGYRTGIAKSFASLTGYALLVGYILGIALIPRIISQRTALILSVLLSIVLVVLSQNIQDQTGTMSFDLPWSSEPLLLPTHAGVWLFALLGFSNAVMWPAIWPLAIEGLGKFTKLGSALLIMAIIGGAILMPVFAKLAELIGSKQQAYLLVMIPSYCYILFFAVKGYKVGQRKTV